VFSFKTHGIGSHVIIMLKNKLLYRVQHIRRRLAPPCIDVRGIVMFVVCVRSFRMGTRKVS